ncbi:MAG: nitrate reductase associated protein [Cyanobacteria bacterium P01_E01_bin.34]
MTSSKPPSPVPSPSHFEFESDFIASWRCIPMRVRLNLDTCGVKLKLVHWHALEESERRQLVETPCETEAEATHYREHLLNIVRDRYGSAPKLLDIPDNPAWEDSSTIPDAVVEKGKEFNFKIQPQQWSSLDRLQRFALIKLSRPSHENKNFYPALQEFGLAE